MCLGVEFSKGPRRGCNGMGILARTGKQKAFEDGETLHKRHQIRYEKTALGSLGNVGKKRFQLLERAVNKQTNKNGRKPEKAKRPTSAVFSDRAA